MIERAICVRKTRGRKLGTTDVRLSLKHNPNVSVMLYQVPDDEAADFRPGVEYRITIEEP